MDSWSWFIGPETAKQLREEEAEFMDEVACISREEYEEAQDG